MKKLVFRKNLFIVSLLLMSFSFANDCNSKKKELDIYYLDNINYRANLANIDPAGGGHVDNRTIIVLVSRDNGLYLEIVVHDPTRFPEGGFEFAILMEKEYFKSEIFEDELTFSLISPIHIESKSYPTNKMSKYIGRDQYLGNITFTKSNLNLQMVFKLRSRITNHNDSIENGLENMLLNYSNSNGQISANGSTFNLNKALSHFD